MRSQSRQLTQQPQQQRKNQSNPYLPHFKGSAEDYTNAAGRFGEVFGILPAVAYLAIIVDLMVCAPAWIFPVITLAMSPLWSIPAGLAVGFLAWRMQMKMAEDDNETALIKAGIVALLTAIPFPLTPILLLFVRKQKD
jgi:hypothetical protein